MNFNRIIHSDIAIVICKFLRPKDICTLCRMYPNIISKVSNIYKHRVAEEIDMFFRYHLGKDYIEFRKVMVRTNAILSGSLILQLILGERWVGSDIDLFVKADPINISKTEYNIIRKNRIREKYYAFYNWNYEFGLEYTELHNLLYKFQDEMNAKYSYVTHSQYMDEMGENVILRVNNYIKNKNIFQVVEINSEKYDNLDDFINTTVDFDICKNIFRYTTIDNDQMGFELNVDNMKGIINRTTQFKYVHSLALSKERRNKYVKRGFKFTYNNDPLGNYNPNI